MKIPQTNAGVSGGPARSPLDADDGEAPTRVQTHGAGTAGTPA